MSALRLLRLPLVRATLLPTVVVVQLDQVIFFSSSLLFVKAAAQVPTPKRQKQDSVGVDLYMPKEVAIRPGEEVILDMGLTFKFPFGVAGAVMLRLKTQQKFNLYIPSTMLGKSWRLFLY